MEWTQIYTLIERFGLPVALLFLFIWLDLRKRKQEDRDREAMIARMAKLEDYQRDKMERMVVENTTAQQNLTEASLDLAAASRETSQTQKQLILTLRTRPCIKDAVREIQRGAEAEASGGGGE